MYDIFYDNKIVPGAYNAQINADWQRKLVIGENPISIIPTGYIMAYKEAADTLIEQLSPSDTRMDYLVYPIFFLYRQYLELVFKETYRYCYCYNSNRTLDSSRFQNMIKEVSHDIVKSFYMISSEFQDRLSKESSVKTEYSDFTTAIEQISSYDRNSFAFRYYYEKNLHDTIPSELTVNLLELKKLVDDIDTVLYDVYN